MDKIIKQELKNLRIKLYTLNMQKERMIRNGVTNDNVDEYDYIDEQTIEIMEKMKELGGI